MTSVLGLSTLLPLLLLVRHVRTARSLTCGGNVTFQHESSVSLSSPGYPTTSYPDSQNCTWTVNVPAYNKIEVIIEHVNLRGDSSVAQCAGSDAVEFITPAGTLLGRVCSEQDHVDVIDRNVFFVRFLAKPRPGRFPDVSGFRMQLHAVPYFDLKCTTHGFDLTLPFSKLQNPSLYPYATYRLSNESCRSTVLRDRLHFSSRYSACGTVEDPEDSGMNNKLIILPSPSLTRKRPLVELPIFCKFPQSDVIVSASYNPANLLPMWSQSDIFHANKTGTSRRRRAAMHSLEADIQFDISLNVFNNDEFHARGQSHLWRPSDVFLEVSAPASLLQYAIRAEECWYTSTVESDDVEKRYLFLRDSCPTESDPVVRYPSSDQQDRFSHTLSLTLPGPKNRRYVHCRVKICTGAEPEKCAKDCVTSTKGNQEPSLIPLPKTTPASNWNDLFEDAEISEETTNGETIASFNPVPRSAVSASNGKAHISLPATTVAVVTFPTTGHPTKTTSIIKSSSSSTPPVKSIKPTDFPYAVVDGDVPPDDFPGSRLGGLFSRTGNGINTDNGPVMSVNTNRDGQWQTGDFIKERYVALVPSFAGNPVAVLVPDRSEQSNQNGVVLPPAPAGGKFRITLSWGREPPDLDAHLTGPRLSSPSPFHVSFEKPTGENSAYFRKKVSEKSGYLDLKKIDLNPAYVMLDVDKLSGYGTETITILRQTPGIYRYFVQDYTNRGLSESSFLANSGATIKIYIEDSLTPAKTFRVPNTAGTLWTVFQIEGDRITPINRVTYHVDNKNMPLF